MFVTVTVTVTLMVVIYYKPQDLTMFAFISKQLHEAALGQLHFVHVSAKIKQPFSRTPVYLNNPSRIERIELLK
jgi:hypothetical protein